MERTMNIKEILGYHADNHRSYQTGEGTEAPVFIYADADYEVGDGKCGLHEIVRNANEPAIVYVRADSFMSRNEWLQEQIDILTTANLWKARAERAEAENKRLMEALKPFAKAPYTGPNSFNRAALSDIDFWYARMVYADAMEATDE